MFKRVEQYKPDLVCLSALLTTTMMEQRTIIEDIEKSGLRDQVMIMVGGAPVTDDFAKEIGADAFSADAASAAEVAVKLLKERKLTNV